MWELAVAGEQGGGKQAVAGSVARRLWQGAWQAGCSSECGKQAVAVCGKQAGMSRLRGRGSGSRL